MDEFLSLGKMISQRVMLVNRMPLGIRDHLTRRKNPVSAFLRISQHFCAILIRRNNIKKIFMNENSFVAVGRIERVVSAARGLTLLIGGAGPVKALVAVQLRDPALVKLVTTPGTGFAAGDVVSIGGHLEYDAETQQNVAIAAPNRVSRIARGGAVPAAARAAPALVSAGLFGHTGQAQKRTHEPGAAFAALPLGFPMHGEGTLVDLGDVHL
jgi:hypothetical protein